MEDCIWNIFATFTVFTLDYDGRDPDSTSNLRAALGQIKPADPSQILVRQGLFPPWLRSSGLAINHFTALTRSGCPLSVKKKTTGMLSFYPTYLLVFTVCVSVTQLCPTRCDPMDCSPPGTCVHGILQARILEWVALPFSRESS